MSKINLESFTKGEGDGLFYGFGYGGGHNDYGGGYDGGLSFCGGYGGGCGDGSAITIDMAIVRSNLVKRINDED